VVWWVGTHPTGDALPLIWGRCAGKQAQTKKRGEQMRIVLVLTVLTLLSACGVPFVPFI